MSIDESFTEETCASFLRDDDDDADSEKNDSSQISSMAWTTVCGWIQDYLP